MQKSTLGNDLLTQADKLKKRGDFHGAIQILHKVIASDPHCHEAYEELGDNYLSLRELTKAEKALIQAVTVNPRSPNGNYLLGFLYSLEQKWFKSVDFLIKADNLMPNHAEILRCLGWSLYNQARKNQGLAILERSQNLNPNDQNILCDLGVCYMNSGQMEKASETFKKVISINPNSEQAKECFRFLEMIQAYKVA